MDGNEQSAKERRFAELLSEARRGEPEAMDQLMPLVYDRLKLLARRQRRGQPAGHTLDTTGLVHEAYLKLARSEQVDWQDRNHFLCLAAVAMRHILVDHARRRSAKKRGGDGQRVTFTESGLEAERSGVEIVALDDALKALEARNERLSQLVELRYFGGLSVQETAAALDVSERTVKRDWRKARAFLHRELAAG